MQNGTIVVRVDGGKNKKEFMTNIRHVAMMVSLLNGLGFYPGHVEKMVVGDNKLYLYMDE